MLERATAAAANFRRWRIIWSTSDGACIASNQSNHQNKCTRALSSSVHKSWSISKLFQVEVIYLTSRSLPFRLNSQLTHEKRKWGSRLRTVVEQPIKPKGKRPSHANGVYPSKTGTWNDASLCKVFKQARNNHVLYVSLCIIMYLYVNVSTIIPPKRWTFPAPASLGSPRHQRLTLPPSLLPWPRMGMDGWIHRIHRCKSKWRGW